jgi:hypothetical protein
MFAPLVKTRSVEIDPCLAAGGNLSSLLEEGERHGSILGWKERERHESVMWLLAFLFAKYRVDIFA